MVPRALSYVKQVVHVHIGIEYISWMTTSKLSFILHRDEFSLPSLCRGSFGGGINYERLTLKISTQASTFDY
jgi:hypothetical protein